MILSVLALREFYHLSWTEVASISGSLWCFCLYRYGLSVIQALGEWRSYNLLNVLGNVAKALVIPTLFAGALIGLNRYDGAIYGYLVGNLVLAILTLVFLGIRARIGAGNSLLRRDLWSVVWPLGVANICIIATMRYGVFLVEKVLGSERLAVFSAANTLALVFPLISISIMNVVVRESANSEKTQFLGAILRNQRKYLPFLGVVLLVSMLLAKPVTVLLFGPDYADAGGILAWMLIPYIGGIFFTPLESYLYVHEQKVVMTMKIAQFFIMAAITSALISRIELYSIVVGTVVSRLAGWAFVYHRARRAVVEASSV